jgi:hypothetical protein
MYNTAIFAMRLAAFFVTTVIHNQFLLDMLKTLISGVLFVDNYVI